MCLVPKNFLPFDDNIITNIINMSSWKIIVDAVSYELVKLNISVN